MKNKILLIFIAGLLLSLTLTAQEKMPDREERILALSIIWKEMNYTFAFPENVKQIHMDSLYMAYLPKVENTKNRFEYFRALSAFTAHFNEAHTRIYAYPRPDDMPPLNLMNIGEHIIVNEIAKSLSELVPLGSEILKINHIPVLEFLKDSVYPYIGAATSHWKFQKGVMEMLYGEPLSPIRITVQTPNGLIKEVEMIRDYNAKGGKEEMIPLHPSVPPINIRILESNIGYIQLTSCLGQFRNMIDSVFISSLPKLRDCKGLIIDLRGNRGGTDEAWNSIAYYTIPESQFDNKGKWLSRKYIPSYKMWGEYDPQLKDYFEGTAMEQIRHAPYTNPVADSLKLNQPLVIISGKHVASAAEDFLLLMKEMERATIVGGASVGCVGEPMFIPLWEDWELMLCAKKYVNPDGSQPNTTGILPDIPVEESYEAYLEGRDNLLEAAINELNKQILFYNNE